jgi:hypothetical protein
MEALAHLERARRIVIEDPAAAADAFDAARRLAPDNFAATHDAGVARLRLERREEALPLFRLAARLRPSIAVPWTALGSSLHALDRHHESAHFFERAVRARPDDVHGWAGLGNHLAHMARPGEALALLDRAVLLAEENVRSAASRSGASGWTALDEGILLLVRLRQRRGEARRAAGSTTLGAREDLRSAIAALEHKLRWSGESGGDESGGGESGGGAPADSRGPAGTAPAGETAQTSLESGSVPNVVSSDAPNLDIVDLAAAMMASGGDARGDPPPLSGGWTRDPTSLRAAQRALLSGRPVHVRGALEPAAASALRTELLTLNAPWASDQKGYLDDFPPQVMAPTLATFFREEKVAPSVEMIRAAFAAKRSTAPSRAPAGDEGRGAHGLPMAGICRAAQAQSKGRFAFSRRRPTLSSKGDVNPRPSSATEAPSTGAPLNASTIEEAWARSNEAHNLTPAAKDSIPGSHLPALTATRRTLAWLQRPETKRFFAALIPEHDGSELSLGRKVRPLSCFKSSPTLTDRRVSLRFSSFQFHSCRNPSIFHLFSFEGGAEKTKSFFVLHSFYRNVCTSTMESSEFVHIRAFVFCFPFLFVVRIEKGRKRPR